MQDQYSLRYSREEAAVNIHNNFPTAPQQEEGLPISVQVAPGAQTGDDTSSGGSSEVELVHGRLKLHSVLVTNDSTVIGEALESARLANKELEASV